MAEDEKLNHDAVNHLISLSDTADAQVESLDPGPSYEELIADRERRTLNTMQSLNPMVAKETIPEHFQDGDEERRIKAAITIQSHYRGYVDRCRFLELLYDVYEKEEEERRLRAAQQVEEGEILVANHNLEIDIDDAETTARNKQRRHESYVITIQRAWRSYKTKCKSLNETETNAEEPASPTSQRKTNILCQAQEFADLKKRNDEALPYNAHKATLLSDSSSSESSALSSPEHISYRTRATNPFNKSKVDKELTLPQLDWSQLERSLGHSSSNKSSSLSNKVIRDAHREDVRKRLAMSTPVDGSYGEVYTRPVNKPFRGQNSAMELYVNDCNEEASSMRLTASVDDVDLATKQQQLHKEATLAYSQAGPIAKKIIAVEKKAEEPSDIARLLGISTFRSQGENTLNKKRLESLSLAQLQVVYNAMQNEIERLNDELVEIVVARDELHMQQDSILVNIEDLQRRIEEQSKKHQRKLEAKESKKAAAASKESQPRTTASRMSRLFGLGKT